MRPRQLDAPIVAYVSTRLQGTRSNDLTTVVNCIRGTPRCHLTTRSADNLTVPYTEPLSRAERGDHGMGGGTVVARRTRFRSHTTASVLSLLCLARVALLLHGQKDAVRGIAAGHQRIADLRSPSASGDNGSQPRSPRHLHPKERDIAGAAPVTFGGALAGAGSPPIGI